MDNKTNRLREILQEGITSCTIDFNKLEQQIREYFIGLLPKKRKPNTMTKHALCGKLGINLAIGSEIAKYAETEVVNEIIDEMKSKMKGG